MATTRALLFLQPQYPMSVTDNAVAGSAQVVVAAYPESRVDESLMPTAIPVPLENWFTLGWRLVPGGTPSTTLSGTTTLIVEREIHDDCKEHPELAAECPRCKDMVS